jgi:MerR family transcriptional regulator, light-induced transcriptional regulator
VRNRPGFAPPTRATGPAGGRFREPAQDPLTIQQVSEALAVPVSTLRSWERRYDLPRTARTRGGHRRYPAEALDELRLMRDEIARGKRAAEAAASARLLLQPDGPARLLVERFLDATREMDPTAVRTCLDDATDELGLGAMIDDVLLPAMRRIGRWWETGRCDVGHEHVATEAARTWLGRAVAFAPAAPEPPRTGPILLACGPRDTHSLGLEAFCALLTRSGRACRLLGARTPVATLVTAARTVGARGVVVVSHLSAGRRPAVEAITAAAALGVPVFYAGNAFIALPVRRRLPGIHLGDSQQEALRTVEAVLGPRPA